MKTVISKVLIAGSLFMGFGLQACENKKENNENYQNVPVVTNTEDAINRYNTPLGEADTTLSDTLNNSRINSMTDTTNGIR